MNPQDYGIFMQTLKAIEAALLPGMTQLRPILLLLMGTLVFFEVIILATGVLWFRTALAPALIRLVLRTGALVATLQAAPALATSLIDGWTSLGLVAGGNAITVAQFMDPGQWLSLGFQTGRPLLTAWQNYSAVSFTGLSVGQAVVCLIAWFVMIGVFIYMGFSLYVMQMQMSLGLVGGQVLLACAACRFTSWLARGAIAYPMNMGFRFFFKALVASLFFVILKKQAAAMGALDPNQIGKQLEAIVVMLILPCSFAVVCWKSNAIAGGLLQGLPGLSVGHMMQAAAGGVAMAMGGAGLVSAGSAGLVRLAAGGAGLATRTAAAVQTAYTMGSATTIGGRMAQIGGGMQGIAMAAGNSALQGVKGLASPTAQAIRQNMMAGRQAGFVASGGTFPHAAGAAPRPGAPAIAQPGSNFPQQLRQTLATGAYYFGHDHDHGGATPHF